jgi:twitching motility protein PilT
MKSIQQILLELARPEIIEFAVVTDRLPCFKIGEKYEPVDDVPRTTAAILEMLGAAGGGKHVSEIEKQPAHWSTRIEGVGQIGIQAVMRGGRIQARFAVTHRSGSLAPSPLKSLRARGSASTAAPDLVPERPSTRASNRAPERKATRASSSSRAPAIALAPEPSALRAPAPAPPIGLAPEPARAPALAPVRPRAASSPGRAGEDALDHLLAMATEAHASDLHVVAGRPPLLRTAGDLAPHGAPIDEAAAEKMIRSIVPDRLMAVLDEVGSCDFALDRGTIGRFRVSVSRQRTGLKACLRCVPAVVPTLADLGLPAEIERATHHHQGLVLVTGPTGHGKTSTLAAIVDIINRDTTHHVITVEDPVEFVHGRKKAMISQREVGSSTRTFASALKGSLREDPDVIVVGELRDTETVRMALAASETGHLVLGTMNTPSCAKTIDRVVDLFPPSDQQQVRMTLAGGLHLIVGQRLVPTSDGKGMVAAAELLPGSVALWSMIRDGKTFQIPSLQQRGRGVGILRLDESLAELVKSGRVTAAAAALVCENPDDLAALLAGRRGPQAAPSAPEPSKNDGGGLLKDAGGLLGKAGQIFGKRGG